MCINQTCCILLAAFLNAFLGWGGGGGGGGGDAGGMLFELRLLLYRARVVFAIINMYKEA